METPRPEGAAPPTAGARTCRHIYGMVAFVALAIAVGAWFWMARETPQPQAGIGVPHGVIVVCAGAFVAALIAELRASGIAGVLEAAFALIAGLFALVAAIVRGIASAIAGLFGWR